MQDKEHTTPREQVELLDSEVILTGFFHVEKLQLRHTLSGSRGWSPPLDRYLLNRPDAVCAVVFHSVRNVLLFVRQFRVGIFQKDHGWMTELAAGLVDHGETPGEAILRELEEELGYQPKSVQQIRRFYTSPGIIDERIYLYYAEIDDGDRTGKGGGRDDEHEDLEMIEVPVTQIREWMAAEPLLDAKTVIGIQWFLQTIESTGESTA